MASGSGWIDEADMLDALTRLAGACRVYRIELLQWQPYVDRLADDYGPAAALSTSMTVAQGNQPHPALGTPGHIERAALEMLNDLSRAGGAANGPRR